MRNSALKVEESPSSLSTTFFTLECCKLLQEVDFRSLFPGRASLGGEPGSPHGGGGGTDPVLPRDRCPRASCMSTMLTGIRTEL